MADNKKTIKKKGDTYTYEGQDSNGKRLQGELVAASLPLAKAILREKGVLKPEIKKKIHSFI